MNPKEKYNSIIEMIESCVENQEQVNADLICDLAQKSLMDVRDLTALFKFMLDDTVKQYIVKRKLMAAYKFIVESNKLEIWKAIDISGYDNHSSFNKVFKSTFGMTPSEAHKEKRLDLIIPPQTWDVISSGPYCRISEKAEDSDVDTKRFNISADTYEKVVQIEKLRAIYDLPDLFDSLIQELVDNLNLTYELAFEYADALYEYGGEYTYDEENKSKRDVRSPDEELRKVAFDSYNMFIFFDCDLSLGAGWELEFETGLTREQLMAEQPEILAEYLQWNYTDHIDYGYFRNGYIYYQEKVTDEYDEENYYDYMNYVCCGMPKEIAFNTIIPNNDDYVVYTYEDLELDNEIAEEIEAENMQEEREKWLFQ